MKKIFLSFIMVLFTASLAFAEFDVCKHFPDYCKAEADYESACISVEMCEKLKCDNDSFYDVLMRKKMAMEKHMEEQEKVIEFLRKMNEILKDKLK